MPTRSNAPVSTTADQTAPRPGADRLVGVFRTLADQHAQVAGLFEQVKTSPESRALLWPQIRRELVSHEHSEVRELYPVLRQLEETRAFADHHDQEARELDALIARLDALDISSDEWTKRFAQLVKTVLHHAKDEEEAKIFPIAQQALGEARAIELDAKVLAAKQKLAAAN
jgi:hemerythrin superfamily protein